MPQLVRALGMAETEVACWCRSLLWQPGSIQDAKQQKARRIYCHRWCQQGVRRWLHRALLESVRLDIKPKLNLSDSDMPCAYLLLCGIQQLSHAAQIRAECPFTVHLPLEACTTFLLCSPAAG